VASCKKREVGCFFDLMSVYASMGKVASTPISVNVSFTLNHEKNEVVFKDPIIVDEIVDMGLKNE
jgi:hypothetical protein